jgi:hypothetical protein
MVETHSLKSVAQSVIWSQKPLPSATQSCTGVSSQISQAATTRMITVKRQPLRQPRPGIFMGLAPRPRPRRESGCCGGGGGL